MTKGSNRKYGILILLLLLTSCGDPFMSQSCTRDTVSSMYPQCIIQKNKNADFFVFNHLVYQYDHNYSDNININESSIGQYAGTIEVSGIKKDFTDLSATKLPVGTKIYEHKENSNILFAQVNDVYYPYFAVIEG